MQVRESQSWKGPGCYRFNHSTNTRMPTMDPALGEASLTCPAYLSVGKLGCSEARLA